MVGSVQAMHPLGGCQGDQSASQGRHSVTNAVLPSMLLTMGLLVPIVGMAYTVMRSLTLPQAAWWPSMAGALAWFILSTTLAVTLA